MVQQEFGPEGRLGCVLTPWASKFVSIQQLELNRSAQKIQQSALTNHEAHSLDMLLLTWGSHFLASLLCLRQERVSLLATAVSPHLAGAQPHLHSKKFFLQCICSGKKFFFVWDTTFVSPLPCLCRGHSSSQHTLAARDGSSADLCVVWWAGCCLAKLQSTTRSGASMRLLLTKPSEPALERISWTWEQQLLLQRSNEDTQGPGSIPQRVC